MTLTPPFGITVLYRGELPNHVLEVLRSVSHDAPLAVLARTVATTGSWRAEQPLALVVRTKPDPLLAAIGRIGPRQERMLAALCWKLDTVLPHLRYVDHGAVTDACVRLADQLVEHLGTETLERAVFTAIPRGGLIVLGQLAYVLGLRHDQLAVDADDADDRASDSTRPLLVVDDCLLSGVRSTRFLDTVTAPSTRTGPRAGVSGRVLAPCGWVNLTTSASPGTSPTSASGIASRTTSCGGGACFRPNSASPSAGARRRTTRPGRSP